MSHWYQKNGSSAYTIVGENGRERATTLRDARKLDLLPSVTTILNVSAKPALDLWKQKQVLASAIKLPRAEGEAEKDYIDRVMYDSVQASKEAADRGSAIHQAVEDYFNNKVVDEYRDLAKAVDNALVDHYGSRLWLCERSFSHELGYGGKCDMYSNAYTDFPSPIVIDIKTKEGSLDKVEAYDEHLMQLAAYRMGLNLPNAVCANVFVSTNGEVKIIEHSEDDIVKSWVMFGHLLLFWKLKNNFS